MDRATGKIVGYIEVSQHEDLELNYSKETQDLIELPVDHRALHNQADYVVEGKSLVRDLDPAP
ncbi:MAG TPA: hypothetical protein VGT06_06965 [Candidatus Methylomirabilis sp.]|nr:hypothetical protein [Candidatus Methylomirabilis sp.]